MKKQSVLDDPFEVTLPCIRLKQPIGEFFVAAINAKTLCEITFADVRRIYGDNEVDSYLGIQREVSPKRVKELGKFVNTVDACFPTAVILAVDGKCARFDSINNTLTLSSYFSGDEPEDRVNRIDIAKVLDGQHRIEGLRHLAADNFEINVSAFVDMDIENQAYVFSMVNLAQTKVNRSLVYDLYEYARARSPQKTAHNIAVALDATKSSPLHMRIKRLGVATKGRFSETITQARFVEGLLPYLTKDATKDRDTYLRGHVPSKVNANELRDVFLRNMFIEEQDLLIGDILLNYFEAVKLKWRGAWDYQGEGRMLNKSNGFSALMKLLRPAYLHIAGFGEVPTIDQFHSLFDRSKMQDEDFNVDDFKPGTSGESALFHRLLADLRLQLK